MKKIISIVIAGMMAAAVLSGCGGESVPEAEDVQSTEAVAEVETINPELADSWYKVDKLFGVDSYTVYYAAKVQNPDANHYWTSVSVEAKLLDADGNEIGNASEYIRAIEPGASQAVVGVASCETEPTSVEITMTENSGNASEEAPEDYITADNFEVSDIVIGETTFGDVSESLTGKLKNLSDRAVERVKYTILFTKEGKIVNAATSYVRDIEALGTGDMDTLVNQSDYDNYEIYFSGTAAQ